MMGVMRHFLIGIFCSLFLASIMMGIYLLAFPLDDWSLLLERYVMDLPFLVWAFTVPALVGGIIGASIGLYWHQRLHRLDRQLKGLIKGQKVIVQDETEKEIEPIQASIEQLQVKLNKQAELAQRLATERAHERERSLQEIVVQERNRLARELHDSVSQQLFAASMMMSAINESNAFENASMRKQLRLVEKMINQSQLEMRALLLHLRPVALKGKSLIEGVKELLKELEQKVPIDIELQIENVQVDKGVEDHLFRILQESLSNTLRHANATTLHVMLVERDGNVILRVVDNGIGFHVEEVKTSSYGLQNMEERANEIGGTFKMISLPNQGTRLEVKVPRIEREGEGR